MHRRIHLPAIQIGPNLLDAQQAHHARHVLRLEMGESVEVFDDIGNIAHGVLADGTSGQTWVKVETILDQSKRPARLIVASAVPKGERADWMIEKLSELGVSEFVPLRTQRAVVLPEGTGKTERWKRIAIEAARQSRRVGVMTIQPLTDVKSIVDRAGWFMSTQPDAKPIKQVLSDAASDIQTRGALTLFIGPEGGWTPEEIEMFRGVDLTGVSLGTTILRTETAAVAAAVVASVALGPL